MIVFIYRGSSRTCPLGEPRAGTRACWLVGRQNGPLRRIGSSGEAFCPVGVVVRNMVPHLCNPDTGGGQEGMAVAERQLAEAVERQPAREAEREEAGERQPPRR